MSGHPKLFALDIGTRTCVGIILEEKEDRYHVVDMLSLEHEERAMLDGQIHDVPAVAKLITKIKDQLEKSHGPLHKVCVAAAGRALKTERSEITLPINKRSLLQKEDILHLELLAVQQAQASVAEKQMNEDHSHYYYCVGYSVLYYRLDGEEIGSLMDQQGKEASVEIIATFLPKVVVESLLAALNRAGLEMEALTLEPIAAINVLVPPSMRRLNVALVDIGAGTSDIAITDMGTVISYGMVPIAGDEITEAISEQFLLDFPLAETAKRELISKEEIILTDILGFETTLTSAEVIKQITPSVSRLATSISQEILSLNNQKPPKAVMLVGGGSLTPELPRLLAEQLQLPVNRVAIRGSDAISSLTMADHIQKGPELVTPVGIALAAKQSPVQYVTVHVNQQPVRLFEMKTLTVADCLLTAGLKISQLYGRPGLALMITLNDQSITLPGEYGQPPILLKNGVRCSLEEVVKNGDQLTIEKGEDGAPASITISELLDEVPTKQVQLNEEVFHIRPLILCNGVKVDIDKEVYDRDQIVVHFPSTIAEFLDFIERNNWKKELSPFNVQLNGKETYVEKASGKILKNGLEATLSSLVADGDHLVIEKRQTVTVRDLADAKHYLLSQTLPVRYDGKEIILKKDITVIARGEQVLKEDDVLQPGDVLTITHLRMTPFIFQDIFKIVEIDMPSDSSGSFILLKNNEETQFDEELDPFDDLRILWTKKQEIKETR